MKNRTCRMAWTMIALALTAIQSAAQSTHKPYSFTTSPEVLATVAPTGMERHAG